MHTVYNKSEKSIICNLFESEILGEQVNGLVSLQMKMRHGMITKVLKINLTIPLRMMEIGGCDMMTSKPNSTSSIFAKSSLQLINSSQFKENGKETLQEVHTHLKI